MSIQEEKEMILIDHGTGEQTENHAGHQCKMRTAQRGGRVALSLPIDTVIGGNGGR